jgi:hypothetical protein
MGRRVPVPPSPVGVAARFLQGTHGQVSLFFFSINEGFPDFVGVVLLDEDDVLRPPVVPRFCYILVLYKGFSFYTIVKLLMFWS